MADAAARREARRRRILENSELRLQKISGSASPIINSNDKITPVLEPFLPKSLSGLNIHEDLLTNSDSLWTPTPDIEHHEFERKFQQLQNQLYGENNLFGLPTGPRQLNTDAGHHNNHQANNIFDCLNQAGLLLTENQKNSTKTSTTDDSETHVIKFLAGLWIYVVLAAIVNIMMIFKMEHLFGTSVLVPFIIVLTSRIWLFQKKQPPQVDSMMMTALILFKIRPQLMNSIKIFIKLSTIIFKELFFYIFSFVLIYNFISHYWLNIVDLNQPKIIDNSQDL